MGGPRSHPGPDHWIVGSSNRQAGRTGRIRGAGVVISLPPSEVACMEFADTFRERVDAFDGGSA
ncbi:hypothetical protein BRC93_10035 [Halobacteriales archaeon QS_5_70_15]|nr:MAG: hypothetical protein BRC93_10035 [Halobacteriales archaeon QS_5_70_15]